MLSQWQETKEEHEKSFTFGKSTFYPMIIHLFRNGVWAGEFQEEVESNAIVHFLERHAHENLTVVSSIEKWKKLTRLQVHQPLFAACITENYADACPIFAHLFLNKTVVDMHGYAIFARVANPDLCQAIHENWSPCTLVAARSGSLAITGPFVPKPNATNVTMAVSMYNFMRMNRLEIIPHLTPDNSWKYMSDNAVLVVVLSNDFEGHSKKSLVSEYENLASVYANDRHVVFVWAEEDFATQFDITDTPALLLFDSIAENFTHIPTKSKDAIVKGRAWLSGGIDEIKRRYNLRDELEETVDVANATAAESANTTNGSNNTNHKNTTTKNEKTDREENGNEETDKKKSKESKRPTWQNSKSTQLYNISTYDGQSWYNIFRNCLTEFGEYLEAYGDIVAADPAAIAKSPTLQHLGKLLQVGNDLLKREPYRGLAETFPKTPQQLKAAWDRDGGMRIRRLIELRSRAIEDLEATLQNATQDERAEHMKYVNIWSTLVHGLVKEMNRIWQQKEKEYAPAQSIEIKFVERRSASELSVEEFINDYEKKRIPVIITDLDMFDTPWTYDHIKEKCGSKMVSPVQKNPNTMNWGGLEDVGEGVNVSEFIDTFRTNETRRKWYIHDWGLPRKCPEIMGDAPYSAFRYPKYVAGDYFQRAPFIGYQHSWPSLFIGANGTESKLHIDSGGTNFWLYLLEGEKEWRFFDRKYIPYLYREAASAHFYLNAFDIDMDDTPLVSKAVMYKAIQRPGDFIYIPAGCPHAVRNNDDILGISMNYVDISNLWLYLWQKNVGDDFDDFEVYTNPNFPGGMSSKQRDLTFGEFKSTRWHKLKNEFDILE